MMKREKWFNSFILPMLFLCLSGGSAMAELDVESELRHARIQLRQSEEDRAELRAKLEQLEQRLANSESELASYVSREREVMQQVTAMDASARARPAISGVHAQRLRNAEVAALREEQVRYAQAVDNLRQLLSRNEKELGLNQELIDLCRARNLEMYAVASEIMNFAQQSTSCQSGTCEPFLQLQRVKMENTLQDFDTRLRQERIYEDTLPPSLERLMMEELGRRESSQEQGEAAPE